MQKNVPTGKRPSKEGYLMFLTVLPFLILSFIFSYFPLSGWIFAFFDYRAPLKLSQCEFVGFKWFVALFANKTQLSQLWQVMKNTFAMSSLGILTSVIPMFFAIFLNEIRNKRFKAVVQTLTTIPNFISWVLVYSVAFSLFAESGLFNSLLQQYGLITAPIKFLDSDKHTYLSMLLWSQWKNVGWGAIMYLAAVAGIDQELYDAAKVDGAGRFALMRHITLPALLPTYFVLLMLSVANFLNNGMDQYFVFQNAFNKNHIQVLDLYVYNIGISGNSISIATAISMLKSLVSISLLCVVNFLSKKTRGEAIF
ncbi:MAG: ABC transporter permease subunit [Lachnospiraceae bacterium]|nr:ABC transporter permease subunit [Lachnospiraceae bacterium]